VVRIFLQANNSERSAMTDEATLTRSLDQEGSMNASKTHFQATQAAPAVGALVTRRPVILVAATAAPLLVWLVARVGFGLDVRSPTFNGQHFEIGPVLVLLTALVPCLLGWGFLVFLERMATRARVIWIAVALIGLALSLSMPLSGMGPSVGDRIALVLMHLSVGVVLIPGLARTVRSRA
jgi:uncharacterized protein DUF6069